MTKYFFLLISLIGMTVFAGYDYDGNSVLFRTGHEGEYITQMPGVKRSNFSIMDTEMGDSNIYGKDNKHVYFQGRIIPYADPKTFQLIGPESGKDTKYVFLGMKRIEGADPATFSFYNDDPNSRLSFDKNGFFMGTEKINSPVNMGKMQYLGPWVWDDKNVFWFDAIYVRFVRIDFLRPDSMGVSYTHLYCVRQDGSTYCPLDGSVQDQKSIVKVDEYNIDTFLSYFTHSFFADPDLLKMLTEKYLDTPEKRTILQMKIKDLLLKELTSQHPKNKTISGLGAANFLIRNYYYFTN